MAEPTQGTPQVEPRLRVAVISMHTSPTAPLGLSANGGMNVYVREACAAFALRGVATDVYTRAADGRARVERLSPLSRVIYLPAGDAEASKYLLLPLAAQFGEAIEERAHREGVRYNLVHSHYWLSGIAACRLRSLIRVPWAHTAHTLALVKNRNLADGARPEPPERIRAEHEIAAEADCLIASTDSEAEEWAWAYGARPERIRVVPPGVDLSTFHPEPRSQARRRIGYANERLLVFVGRLERLKGCEVALRALALGATGPHSDVRLLVIGEDSRDADESEEQRLRNLARHLHLDGRVDFLGSVPQRRLRHYYAAAEACLMPSHSESFGLVALEAQASGTPVIAADVTGLRSVVRDQVTGFLVDGHDPAAYAERLRRLLDEPELSQQMGRRGTLLAQRYTWARTAERLLEVYDDLGRPVQAGLHSGLRQE